MRILLLTELWTPRVGGVETYLSELVRSLDAQKTVVIAPRAEVVETQESLDVRRMRFFYPYLKPTWLPLALAVVRVISKEKIDVLVCGKALFEGLLGYYVKRILGIPYIICTYASEVEVWKQERPKVLRKVLANASRVIYINDVTRKSLQRLDVHEEKLVKIQPGVSGVFFNDVSNEDIVDVRKRYGIEGAYILSVCRLIPRKGIDDAIRAWTGIPEEIRKDVSFIIAGDGPMRDELEAIARTSDASIRVIGTVDAKDMPALYAGALYFVLPTKNINGDMEGFGIVYAEAAAVGTPSIATSVGGASEAIIHDKTGVLVDPDSPDKLRDAMRRLLVHDEERKRMGSSAQAHARDTYAWKQRGEILHRTLSSLV